MSLKSFCERAALDLGDPLLGGISLGQRDSLARMEPMLPNGCISWTATGVRLGSFCGVLQVASETWEILPKVWQGPEAPDLNRRLLLHLLLHSRRLPWLEAWPGALAQQRKHLFEFFIALFSKELRRSIAGGLARAYRNEQEILPVLRGKLDVLDHARRAPSEKHLLSCSFGEFDEDIPLNRILLHCLEKLSRMVRSNSLRRELDNLRFQFDGVSPWRFNRLEMEQLKLNRTQSRFQPAWEQCKWLLNGFFPDVSAGRQQQGSVLFDMEQIFESAVCNVLGRQWSPKGYRCHFQGPQQPLVGETGSGRKIRRMKPDIILDSPTGRRIALDCKWKALDPAAELFGISQPDLYQLHTYMVEYGAEAGGLIFPWASGLPKANIRYQFIHIGRPLWLIFVPLENFLSGDPDLGLTEVLRDP